MGDHELSANKQTVMRYMQAFERHDHSAILACLCDDVEWILPGLFHHVGKAAFDAEIENDNFSGKPLITVTRVIEDGDVLVAEGFVNAHLSSGEPLYLAYCDVFEMRDGLIARLTSYLSQLQSPGRQ